MSKTNDVKKEDPVQDQDIQKQDPPKQDPPIQKAPAAEEREDIFIPRAVDGEEKTLFVCINGVSYLLPKGKTSNVPKSVADEIRRSWAAQDAWDDMAEGLQAESGEPALK